MLSMRFQLFLLMLRRRTDMASARKALKKGQTRHHYM